MMTGDGAAGCLVDTNVAFRRVLQSDPLHTLARSAVDTLLRQHHALYVTPQILIEFHALATRPVEANGLGMTSSAARAQGHSIEVAFDLLPDVPDIYPLWRELVDRHGVLGRQVFDARLVAVMLAHGVTRLLTLNPSHFGRFTEIEVLEPVDVLADSGA